MSTLILSGIILMIVFRFIKKCRPSKGDPFIQHLYYIGGIMSGIHSSIFFVLMILGMDYVVSRWCFYLDWAFLYSAESSLYIKNTNELYKEGN